MSGYDMFVVIGDTGYWAVLAFSIAIPVMAYKYMRHTKPTAKQQNNTTAWDKL